MISIYLGHKIMEIISNWKDVTSSTKCFTLGAEIDMEVDVDDSELASDSAGEPTPVVWRGLRFLGRPLSFGARKY